MELPAGCHAATDCPRCARCRRAHAGAQPYTSLPVGPRPLTWPSSLRLNRQVAQRQSIELPSNWPRANPCQRAHRHSEFLAVGTYRPKVVTNSWLRWKTACCRKRRPRPRRRSAWPRWPIRPGTSASSACWTPWPVRSNQDTLHHPEPQGPLHDGRNTWKAARRGSRRRLRRQPPPGGAEGTGFRRTGGYLRQQPAGGRCAGRRFPFPWSRPRWPAWQLRGHRQCMCSRHPHRMPHLPSRPSKWAATC